MDDARRLGVADRQRLAATAEKPGHLRGVLDEMPGLVVEIHLDQHIARKDLAFRADLGAALDLDDLLGRHEDFLEALRKALLLGLLADRRGNLLLETGIDVNDVPAAGHASMLRIDVPGLLTEPVNQPHAKGEHLIDSEEESRGDEYHQKYHSGRDQRLLAGRPGDPPQLLAHLVNKF